MQGNEVSDQPLIMHVEPVLPVRDVIATTDYWVKVLGFHSKWTWGDPPNHGGVTREGMCVQFSLTLERTEQTPGQYMWIRVKQVEELYKFHQKNEAVIVEELSNRPWGMNEYVVKELNGHYLCFSAPISDRESISQPMPEYIRLESRIPEIDEYRSLIKSVGWSPSPDDAIVKKTLAAPLYGVIAVDSRNNIPIGCALLLGDGASFYYVKDVVVRPAWQAKHVGTAMMNDIDRWLKQNGIPHAMVALITGENLTPFYRQFGFGPSYSMQKKVPAKD